MKYEQDPVLLDEEVSDTCLAIRDANHVGEARRFAREAIERIKAGGATEAQLEEARVAFRTARQHLQYEISLASG